MNSDLHPPGLSGIQRVAELAGIDGRKVAVLARDPYANIIPTLIRIEQRRRRRLEDGYSTPRVPQN